jgi:CBS domain-containing protein
VRYWVYRYDYVRGDVAQLDATLRARVTDIIRAATGAPDDRPAADGSFAVPLSGIVAGRTITARVRVTTGVATHEAGYLRIPVQWRGDRHAHLLPDFDGTLELQPEWDSQAQLTLTGSYHVPLGPLGVAVDSTVLNGVAYDTVGQLVGRLAVELERALPSASSARRQLASGPLLRVRDVMSFDPVVIDESTPVTSAAQILFACEISGAPVVSPTGRLVGVISERDLLDKEAPPSAGIGRATREAERRRDARSVGEACTRPAVTTSPDATVHAVAGLMRHRGVGRLVVVDGSEIRGIVSRHDILKALMRSDQQLQAVVDEIISDNKAEHVYATVDWAEVTLSGTAPTRSQATELVSQVSDIDGVVGVNDHLLWEFDDLVTLPMP